MKGELVSQLRREIVDWSDTTYHYKLYRGEDMVADWLGNNKSRLDVAMPRTYEAIQSVLSSVHEAKTVDDLKPAIEQLKASFEFSRGKD